MTHSVHHIIEGTESVLHANAIVFYLWLLSKYPDGATIRQMATDRRIRKRSVQRKAQYLQEVGYLDKQMVGGKMIYKATKKAGVQ